MPVIAFVLSAILILFQPSVALAVSADQVIQDAGITISTDSPQASAQALLRLPSVYALPGTFIYWLKGVIEQIQFMLATTPEQRADLLLQFGQQRLAESYKAINDNNPQAAIEALTSYQDRQQELSGYLDVLSNEQMDMQPFLDQLKDQLNAQQALKDYVEQNVKDPDTQHRISSLLQIQSVQTLAFKSEEETVVLGQRNKRTPAQSSPSATPSATPVSAQP